MFLQLTDTFSIHTVPCLMYCTRSSIRSLKSISAIARERHNRVNHVIAALFASIKWRNQMTAVYCCNYQKYKATFGEI